MIRTFITLLLLLFISTSISFAQHANIRGFLYEKETGEPIIFTPVILKGTKYGAQTDVNGFYSIVNIPQGKYQLQASALGFDTTLIQIEIKEEREIITQKIQLAKRSINLKELVISADRQEHKSETRIGLTKITLKDIKKMPSIGGEPDLAQFLQVLPGVTFTGDQGGQLYIRGGSPVQNKVLIDGMNIYNPFHSIGLFSVFDADIIRNADVSTGGFGAKYGGRISSVMDITTRDGNKKKISGKISTTTIGTKVLLEGPLVKPSEDSDGASSFLFTAKNSYLSKTAPLFYGYANPNRLKFDFLDLYGKLSFNSNAGSKFNAFGFLFQDSVQNDQLQTYRWNSYGAGSNFVAVIPGSQVLVKGNFSYSKYDIKLRETASKDRKSSIGSFNFGIDFTYFINKNELDYGLEVTGLQTEYHFVNDFNVQSKIDKASTEIAAFLRYKINYGNLIIDPSFRLQSYKSIALNKIFPEPRVSAKYLITDRLRLKASTGLYSQNLLSATNNRDIVNLFYGFITSPESKTYSEKFTLENGNVKTIDNPLQRAVHYIAGFEYDLMDNLQLNIEAYNKQFFQLINVNFNKQFESNDESKPDALKKDFIVENGYARGIDFNIKYDYKRFYIWGVYSLGYVSRWDGTRRYQPIFDRRHNVNLVVSYTMGKKLDWDFNVRFNLASGFPVTRKQGDFAQLPFDNINTDYTNLSTATIGTVYGPINAGRLPYYHRLDIGIKKKFTLKNNTILEANAGCSNVYNRENIFYVNRKTGKIEYQLPILPSLGVNWSF